MCLQNTTIKFISTRLNPISSQLNNPINLTLIRDLSDLIMRKFLHTLSTLCVEVNRSESRKAEEEHSTL